MNWKLADGRVYSPPIEDISLHRGVALPDIEKPKKRIAPTRTPVPLAARPPSRKPVPPKSALETYLSMESGIGRQAYLAANMSEIHDQAKATDATRPTIDRLSEVDAADALAAFKAYEKLPTRKRREALKSHAVRIQLGAKIKDELSN